MKYQVTLNQFNQISHTEKKTLGITPYLISLVFGN